MEHLNFLVDSYNLENIVFSKPKKYSEYLVSKVKYHKDQDTEFIIQFPKMTVSDSDEKGISLEFMNSKGYNKSVYNFLSNLDRFVVSHITNSTEEWFGKPIPSDYIKKMYNSFIKAPKTSENRCTLNFGFKTHKNEVKTIFMDKKGNEIDISQFKKDETVECIAKFKYIIFSKDTCFSVWEMESAKLHKKIEKVPKFGFVDDPDDQPKQESDDEDLELSHQFF